MTRWTSLTALLVAALAALVLILQSRSRMGQGLQEPKEVYPSNASRAAHWDLLHHLGGYGPYVSKVHGITHNDTALPHSCRVDQVHMLARHTERYPTMTAGTHMLELNDRIIRANGTLNGSLAFANHWSFFTRDPSTDFEQLTSTGQYAGTLSAFKLGTELRSKYRVLLKQATAGKRLKVWASDSTRVIDTARYCLYGLLGFNWPHYAALEVIPESAERGADTLTPGDTCLSYANDADDFGWNYGSRMVDQFKTTYLSSVQSRIAAENSAFPLSVDEVYVMQEMCAFEIMALGSSKWCDVFTSEDWEGFEYARDLLHYYRSGPGNPYAATMGWLYLNATANILAHSNVGQLFLSFVHDGDIIPMLTALDLFPQRNTLSVAAIDHNRTWRMSDTVPMGARIVFERVVCQVEECWSNALYPNHVYCTPRDEHSVRTIVNDQIVPFPGCQSGLGESCPLSDFLDLIHERGEKLNNFKELCGLSEDAPHAISFLHQ